MMNSDSSKNWINYCCFMPGAARSAGEPGEDRAAAGGGEVNVIAVADGVSNAEFPEAGAIVITQVIIPFLEQHFERIWELPPEKLFTFLSANLGGRFWEELELYCQKHGLPGIRNARGNLSRRIDYYQTTLIACAVYKGRMIFIKFGNGFAAVCGSGGAFLLSASVTEGAGTPDITLLADPTNSEFEIGRFCLPEDIRSIALFSDGADYCAELYDIEKHCLSEGYIGWIEQAAASQEAFNAAVKKIASNNKKMQDDVSAAVMLNPNARSIDRITDDSPLKTLYSRGT